MAGLLTMVLFFHKMHGLDCMAKSMCMMKTKRRL